MSIRIEAVRDYPADRERPSPNWSARPADADISLIVLHATADDGNEDAAEAWMCNPGSKVSAHLHLRRDGTLTRLVADRRKAWHAGVSAWRLAPTGERVEDCNRISLGIEIAGRNDGRELYTAAQYDTLARVVAHYVRQGVLLENVCAHSDIAPHRKTDPGVAFCWPRLRIDVLRLLHPDPDPQVVSPPPADPPLDLAA